MSRIVDEVVSPLCMCYLCAKTTFRLGPFLLAGNRFAKKSIWQKRQGIWIWARPESPIGDRNRHDLLEGQATHRSARLIAD